MELIRDLLNEVPGKYYKLFITTKEKERMKSDGVITM